MEIERQESESLTLRLTESEIRQWNNALNEVCNGFAVANFHAAMGIPEESAEVLLNKLQSTVANQSEVFELEEILAVRNALTMVLAELDPMEFHSRMGTTVEEAKQMRNALDHLTGKLRLYKTA
jgi:uncharacterized protein YukE